MTARQLIMDLIRSTAGESGRTGSIIDVQQLAERIVAGHPESGMSLGEICRAIERAAIDAQAVVLTGFIGEDEAIRVWAELDHHI